MIELHIGGMVVKYDPHANPEKIDPRDIIRLQEKYKAVFDGPEAAEVLGDLMRRSYFMRTTLAPGDKDGSAAREGMRQLVNSIVAFITTPPEVIKKKIEAIEKGGQEDELDF